MLSKIGNLIFDKDEVELSEQVDLKNVAVLDKLFESSDGGKDLKKFKTWVGLADNQQADAMKSLSKSEPKWEKAGDKERKLSRELEQAQDQFRTIDKEVQDDKRRISEAVADRKESEKKLNPEIKKTQKLVSELEKNIASFESAGKALGVTVNTKKYNKLLTDLKKLI